jgi:hypothetical protein
MSHTNGQRPDERQNHHKFRSVSSKNRRSESSPSSDIFATTNTLSENIAGLIGANQNRFNRVLIIFFWGGGVIADEFDDGRPADFIGDVI